MKKEDLRIRKTRKLLCEALFSLLQEKPFEQIKLNEICDKSMVHKTTFYNHFDDKYDLLKYALLELQKELVNEIKNNNENDLVEYYSNLAKMYMKHMKQNKNVYSSLILYNKDSIGVDILFNNFKTDIEKRLRQDKTISIPITYISTYYVSGVFAVVLEWFIGGMKEKEDEMIEYIKLLIGR